MSSIEEAIERAVGSAVSALEPLAGGSLSSAWRAELDDGSRAFAKSRPGAAPGELTLEAAGLRWLAAARAIAVPGVLGVHDPAAPLPGIPPVLVIDWVETTAAPLDPERLGLELAALHAAGVDGACEAQGGHGALPPKAPAGPLRIGPLELPAVARDGWAEVYARDRLEPLSRMARERGAISEPCVRAVERVCDRIDELAGPAEPPSRLHGDLWGGNVIAGAAGEPWLIDPAAHAGHREVDLAMLRLFGSPGERAFSAYEEAAPLAEGHAERVELWQLMPLLVHAVLFGGSYGAAAERVASRYA